MLLEPSELATWARTVLDPLVGLRNFFPRFLLPCIMVLFSYCLVDVIWFYWRRGFNDMCGIWLGDLVGGRC